jgi:hypothetical protein
MGCLLIFAGIFVIANSYGNWFFILLGIALIIWGFSGSADKPNQKKPPIKPGKKRKQSDGSCSSGGYEGHTHTGTGTPTSVHRSDSSEVNTYGNNWRETGTGGRENIVTGETVERDYFGNWTYTDGDGETDNNATFDYDDD